MKAKKSAKKPRPGVSNSFCFCGVAPYLRASRTSLARRFALICLGAGFFSACATAVKTAETKIADAEISAAAAKAAGAPSLYREGLRELEAGDAKQALADFDRFQLESPVSPYSQLALYESGRALEALELWQAASDRYRAVAEATAVRAPRLQALALYRLSYCAEGLGQDDVALAALRDVDARRSDLPPQIADAEFPARVAGAYARLGNLDSAMQFYEQARSGIARLRQAPASGSVAASAAGANLSQNQVQKQALSNREIPEWLPRTLYEMGRASIRKPDWQSYEASLRPLRLGQQYLLQAAETGVAPWSKKAADELTAAYDALFAALNSQPPAGAEDPLLYRRHMQEREWDLAEQTIASLDELASREMPPGARPSRASEASRIARYLDSARQNLRTVLAERPAGEGLTPEAEARRGQIGRTVRPDPILEQEYAKQKGRAFSAHPASVPTGESPLSPNPILTIPQVRAPTLDKAPAQADGKAASDPNL